jgi:hypothetical protein
MGALGCSEGPLPSSVVGVCALAVRTPANARVNITKLPRNLFFITDFSAIIALSASNQKLMHTCKATAVPKSETTEAVVNHLFSMGN